MQIEYKAPTTPVAEEPIPPVEPETFASEPVMTDAAARSSATLLMLLLWCVPLLFTIIALCINISALRTRIETLEANPPQQVFVTHEYHIEAVEPEPLVLGASETTTEMGLPDVSGEFKGYEDYRMITNKTAPQYILRRVAVTDEQGFRKVNGKYLIAVGKYYSTEIGKELRVTIDKNIIDCIVGDIKGDKDTDPNKQYVKGTTNIIEFIVDTKKLNRETQMAGDVSKLGLAGTIVKIEEVKRDDS
jgi:hypothetical protein